MTKLQIRTKKCSLPIMFAFFMAFTFMLILFCNMVTLISTWTNASCQEPLKVYLLVISIVGVVDVSTFLFGYLWMKIRIMSYIVWISSIICTVTIIVMSTPSFVWLADRLDYCDPRIFGMSWVSSCSFSFFSLVFLIVLWNIKKEETIQVDLKKVEERNAQLNLTIERPMSPAVKNRTKINTLEEEGHIYEEGYRPLVL